MTENDSTERIRTEIGASGSGSLSGVQLKGALLQLLATFLWGSSFVVTKSAVEAFPAFMLVALRFLIGGASLLVICRREIAGINRKTVAAGALLAAFYAAGMILQTLGVKYTSAGRSAFLTAAYCIAMPFLEWLILKRRPGLKALAAAACCFVGIGLVALTESFTVNVGDLMTLAGSMGFALEIVLFAKCVRTMKEGALNICLILASGVYLAVISLCTEQMPTSVGGNAWLSMLYLALACTGLPLVCQGKALSLISPTLVTVILGFEAVFAAVLSALIYHERFTPRNLIGFALIFVSVFISLEKTKPTVQGAADNQE